MYTDLLRASLLDHDTRKQTIQHVLEEKEVTSSDNYILAVTFASDFAKSDDERVCVAAIVNRGMRDQDPGYFYLNEIASPREKAEKSLLALSLYRRRFLASKLPHSRHVYEKTGISSFEYCGQYALALNFVNWCHYLEDMLTPSMKRVAKTSIECALFKRVKTYTN